MTRIFRDFIYGSGPRAGCWWDETCDLPEVAPLTADRSCDVAVIGAGFTGLNAARVLADAGREVCVLDANGPGWGASGRNGGFCCLGGAKLSNAQIERRVGAKARAEWRETEAAAVGYVRGLLDRTGADVEAHSRGETWLAHRPAHMRGLEEDAEEVLRDYGVTPEIHSRDDLDRLGMSAGFHGGMTTPLGFGLNPRKYVSLLVDLAQRAGVSIHAPCPVSGLQADGAGWHLRAGGHSLRARRVLIATNGYSSEDLPDWLAGRYMPVQSTVAVSRPLTAEEQARQGWTSQQICYDSRNLLHYFRLMPDGRMLFGLRGGLGDSASADLRTRARVVQHFYRIFPHWSEVELTHTWSGMVSLSADLAPFAGPVPGRPGLFAALNYHGNGVAMGSHTGQLIGRMMADAPVKIPELMARIPRRFPLGRARRLIMPFAYGALALRDL